jgi:hypothetical protein
MKRSFLGLWVLCFIPMRLFAWTNGELLIWMDTDRGHALKPIAQRFEKHFGIKATIETPEKITDSFSLAAQAAKGPDSDGAFPTGVGKPEDQNETSRGEHHSLGLQESLLLVGDSR